MKLSLILTVNNRSAEVSQQVADSFKLLDNAVDELVVVLDRPTKEAREGAYKAYSTLYSIPTMWVVVEGEPGWVCPAKAWNAGYEAATGDLFYCISSEVVQEAGNVARARKLCADGQTVVFGACDNSTAENLVIGSPPGVLVSSKMPRPLGFIVCMPAKQVREIGGNDEEFMKGLWYEDADLFLRLWRTGVTFVFDDEIHGIHLNHDRHDLHTDAGKAKIGTNASHMIWKYSTLDPWARVPRLEQRVDKRLTWLHV